MIIKNIIFLYLLSVTSVILAEWEHTPICVDEIQEFNKNTLITTLQDGWSSFCNCDVDEGVISFYPGASPVDITIDVCGNNGTQIWALREICKLCTINFDPRKKTIIFANGWVSDGVYEIKKKVEEIAGCTHDYNVIIMDFATCITHLYTSQKHSLGKNAYAMMKVVDVLLMNEQLHHDLIFAGYSAGAQIAALCAKMFADDHYGKAKIPLLIAIDPATSCNEEENYITADVAAQVVVYHGNNGNYGLKQALGTVDFYPNGDGKLQAGCKSQVCSHMFALWVWVESICHPSNFYATKCNDWVSFTKAKCTGNDVIQVNIDIPKSSAGKYFCVTNTQSPYGLGIHGTKPSKKV